MGIYNYLNQVLDKIYDHNSNSLSKAYNKSGSIIWEESEEPEEPIEPGDPFVPYTFVAISDVHYGLNCPNENERFTSWCSYTASHMPEFILATGDLANATNYKTTSGANHPRTALNAAGIPYTYGVDGNRVHWAWGNHENNNKTDTLDTLCDEFDATMGKNASKTNWFDFQGDRFIMMHFRTMSGNRAQFTVNDLERLKDALNTAGDKRVFLIQHCPDPSRTICGASGKGDTTHWGYNAPDIEWYGETLDAREIFRRIVDAHVSEHPGKLIWLHGHTHKAAEYNGKNWDNTYFSGNGWTVHIPSLGRPYLKKDQGGATANGEVKTFGEWAVFTVNQDSVSVSYKRVDGNSVTDKTVVSLDAYGFDIPCAGAGVQEEGSDTVIIRLVGRELYVDEAPTTCVRMDGNDIILEDVG